MEANQEIKNLSKPLEDNMTEGKDVDESSLQNADKGSEELQDTIAKLESENEELKGKHLRAMADIENLRKRFSKEKSDLLKYGNEKILEDMLPVLDSFEKALATEVESAADGYIEGMKMVYKQLATVMEKQGLKGFDSQGEEFDPNIHQAIQKIDDESVTSEVVKDEFQKGYMLNDRLLRAAIVSVSIPSTKE